MAEKDYSNVPLWKKLGATKGTRVVVLHPPDAVAGLTDFPDGAARISRNTDVVISFHTRRAPLEKEFPRLLDSIADRGGVWIAWPKKTSRIQHEIDFDVVQKVGLGHGLVDNKICRIDEDWQAMRFVRRRT